MEYQENGSAAVDFYAIHNNTAQPLERPRRLPDAPKRPAQKQQPRVKLQVSALTVLGAIAAAFLLFLVIFNYMRLYEAQSAVSDLKDERERLSQEHDRLQSRYESSIELEQVEVRARQLGMREPLPAQVVYIETETGDTTQVYAAPQEEGFFTRLVTAFEATFSDVVEYFS